MDGNIEKMQSLTGRIKGLGIDKTLTKKGMCAEAEAVGKALATKVSITDIVDDLLSVATDKPLSANQGRLLKKQIDEIDPHYAENVIYNDTNVKNTLDDVVRTLGYVKSKNLLPYPYYSLTAGANGVTWVDNGKGRLTANGTPTTKDSYVQCSNKSFSLPAGTYILNGCPNGGSSSTYYCIIWTIDANETRYNIGADYGKGVAFTLDKTTEISLDIVIVKGYSATNLVFKPMVSEEGGEFEPYVPSVDENLGIIKEWEPDVTTYTSNRCYYVKTKNTVKAWFNLTSNKEITNGSSLTICSDIKARFGVNSNLYAWNKGLAIHNTSVFIDCVIAVKSNGIYVEYGGTTIPNNSNIYGFIEFGIS